MPSTRLSFSWQHLRRAALTLVVLPTLVLGTSIPVDAAKATDRSRLNKIQQNENKIKDKKEKVEELEKQEKDKKNTISDIQQQLERAAKELEVSNRRYEAAHAEVEAITKRLSVSEQLFEDKQKQIEERLQKMYVYRRYAKTNQLMESKNLAELTRKIGYFEYLARQDRKLLEEVKLEREKLARLQYQQMLKRQVLGKKANEQAEAKEEHETLKKKELQSLAAITRQRQAYEREIRALERESQSIADELKRRYASQGSSGQIALGTGRFTNPVPGHPVTSPFGWRVHPIWGTRRLHTGIDFGAPSGTPIRACDSGVVISAGWRGGYGKAVLIDHGQGMVTLYGHSSAYYVSAGQSVKKGQVIAAVGSTGQSTGPHLHLELRQNGVPVNAAPYF